MNLPKKIIASFITLLLSPTVFAVSPTHSSLNPGNVLNTQNQTLPGAQFSNQGEFQTISNPQYLEHAEEVDDHIILKEVQLMNARVIPESVKTIYQNKIGERMTVKDIQHLATDLEAAYRSEGYILVQVILPPQEINGNSGLIKFQVVNGRIKNIIFVGDNPEGARAQLHRYAEQVEVEDPVSYHSIDRFLVLANQLPGIQVSATLVPDKKVTGAADLVVKVQQTFVSAFVNANNRGTQYLGPHQGSMGVSAYDLFGADSLTLTGSATLDVWSEMQYGQLSYDRVYGQYATEINPSITLVSVQPGSTLAPLEMDGSSTKYNLSVNQPLYTSSQQKLTLQSALYHSEAQNNLFTNQLLYQDQITALTLGLNYQGALWQIYHNVTFSLTQGMPILGAPTTLANPSVVNAQTNFTHFNLLTSEIFYFDDKWSLSFGSQFQYAPSTLVSSEQIGYGGQQFGQGFTPYVISGNSGLMGSLALRYDLPLFWHLTQLQPQIFYDAASVYYAPVAGCTNSTAQSAGVGLNLQWTQHLNGTFTLAKPLTISQSAGINLGWAGFFNVTYFT